MKTGWTAFDPTGRSPDGFSHLPLACIKSLLCEGKCLGSLAQGILAGVNRRLGLRPSASRPRLLATLALTSVLISVNWTVYIYCVATHQLVEASLGYYINPLISIALGVLLFGEHISRMRLVAIALATIAVVIQSFYH